MNISLSEKKINEFKSFYKFFLQSIQQRDVALNDLKVVLQEFKDKGKPFGFLDQDAMRIQRKGEIVLERHFSKTLVELYNKEFDQVGRQGSYKQEAPLILSILVSIAESMNDKDMQFTTAWNHKKYILDYTLSCLYHYGLHPDIWKRDESNVFFNVLINHTYNSKIVREVHKMHLNKTQFEADFESLYKKKRRIKFSGELIPFSSIRKVLITTTLLREDEIPLWAQKRGIEWNKDYKSEKEFILSCKDETDKYHPNPDAYSSYEASKNSEVITLLNNYPQAQAPYLSACEKFKKKEYIRNCIDDLRLSLEMLLRDILQNGRSLENQLGSLGNYLKNEGISKEVNNSFIHLIDLYSKYNNNNVKHNNNATYREAKLIFDLTDAFIKHLISL
ncbi:MAG: hypothetical protein JWP69_546 [Flaviaesturariibacter sp.]|nr:hypothetical protein [Flaviaesturariibacter sp.]